MEHWRIFRSKNKTHIQQPHEKMLNITNHQGNANQNSNESSSHTYEIGNQQKEHS